MTVQTINYNNGDKYIGDTNNNGYRHGKGTYYYTNGNVYEGDWVNGNRTGKGKFTWTNGDVYEGDYLNGKYNGKGKYTFGEGQWKDDCFDGSWLNGNKSGKGIYYYAEGAQYEGMYENDVRHGKGVYYFRDGNYREYTYKNGTVDYTGPMQSPDQLPRQTVKYNNGIYEGTMLNAKFHGKGKYTWNNGDCYDGEWVNNKRTGDGVFTWGEGRWKGDSYKGGFQNNYRHGKGIYYYADGSRYEGFYHNGKIHGKGIYYFSNGDYREYNYEYGKEIYKGPLITSSEPVYKTITYSNNEIYEGYISNGKRNGKGKYTWSNGDYYYGDWLDGNQSGEGTYYKAKTNETYTGEFKDNKRHGIGTIVAGNGFSHKVKYKNGKLVKDTVEYKKNCLAPMSQKKKTGNKIIDDNFKDVIGMNEVKDQLYKIFQRIEFDKKRNAQSKYSYNFVLTGNPGTGKTTVARTIAKILNQLGVLEKKDIIEVDRSQLVSEYIGATAKQTMAVIESAKDSVLFIDEAYTLNSTNQNDHGTEAIDTLLKHMEDHRGEYSVIIAGYRQQMEDMLRNTNPGFASRFPIKIHIPNYTEDELADIFITMAASQNFYIQKGCRPLIIKQIQKEMVNDTFDNARCARRLLDKAIDNLAMRSSKDNSVDLSVLTKEDIGIEEVKDDSLEKALKELNELTGLDSVKNEINTIVKQIQFQQLMKKKNPNFKQRTIPLNMVFTGNPGTGKTTVARILLRIYAALGLLKRSDIFVEVSRNHLVGEYLGQTAPKTTDVVNSALGGILFIDEAYSLLERKDDSYGKEAIDTLVPLIENNRQNLVVILAGYTKEMEYFMDSNPGLRSRIPKKIMFEDYSPKELIVIFKNQIKHENYTIKFKDSVLERVLTIKSSQSDFGNARGVRNCVDKVISSQNVRIMDNIASLKESEYLNITDEDIQSIL